jgi:uncharacterized membrane protein YeiH
MTLLLSTMDLVGTFVFALSGAMVGIRSRLDLFGVLVLSFAAANTGGIVRDLLMGATPPLAISHWKYAAVSFLAGLMTFYKFPLVNRLKSPVLVLDAAGLALFAVTGSLRATDSGLGPVPATLLGVLTGIGGGMARDLLIAQTPVVLRADLYAVAALAGSTIVVLGNLLQLPAAPVSLCGAAACFLLRITAIRKGWSLPVASPPAGNEN